MVTVMRFFIDSTEYSTKIGGFTSTPAAHMHLFKHVIPLFEHSEHALEHWEDLIPEPPLIENLSRRTRDAQARLAAIPECLLNQNHRVASCDDCRNMAARKQVSISFSELLTAYLQVANESLDWAFTHPSSSGEPRVLAYRGPDGPTIKTIESRGVKVVASLPAFRGSLRLITCYRETDRKNKLRKSRNYDRAWLDLCREKAGCRRAGTLLEIRTGGAS